MNSIKESNEQYDPKEHYRLLKYSEELKKQGKSLLMESPNDYYKLLTYLSMAYGQFNWKKRHEYLKILEKFLDDDFPSFKLCRILKEKLTLSEELSNSLFFDKIDNEAINFTSLLDDILIACEICDRDPEEIRSPDHIGEIELRKEVEEIYYEVEKYFEQ